MATPKRKKPGRKRITARRKGLNLTPNIVELIAILKRHREAHLGNMPNDSELIREALTAGLHLLIKEESKRSASLTQKADR